VVAAARAVGVEGAALDAVLEQALAGRALGLDRAGRRDVVGGDAVAERDEAAGALDVGSGSGSRGIPAKNGGRWMYVELSLQA
jgi:hypothetical protein